MRYLIVFMAVLMACFIGGAVFLSKQQPHPSADMIAGGAPWANAWPAPEFEFTDQLGRPVSSKTLKGQPYIASFLFTTCRTLCPLLSAKLVMLERKLTQPSLRFVSFSVDPAHDTQDSLAEWHDRFHASEARWVLAKTQPESLAKLADGFGVAVDKGETVEDPIIHSGAFLLVDATGHIVGAFDSTDEDALKRLEAAVEAMLGPATPMPISIDGAKLVHAVGCLGCHLDPALAPPLQGVGRQVMLETGAHVEVDVAYLKESILSPAAKRVHGYSVVMPAYGSRLTPAQVDAMVAFIAAQPVLTDVPEADVAEDPVCHMKVRVVESTPRAEGDGGTAFFCSAACRDAFVRRAR